MYKKQSDRKFSSRTFDTSGKNNNLDPDLFYYNITMNHNPSDGDFPSPAAYSVNQTQPILYKPDDFYCSIVRFYVPGNRIPIFIMPIQPGATQTNPNLTTLSISFTAGGTTYTQFLVYTPDNTITAPGAPSTNAPSYQQVMQNEYYFVFSYQLLIKMINAAINAAITAAGGALAAAQGTSFQYDPTTQLISLIVPYAIRTGQAINFYCNTAMRIYLDSFRASAGDNSTALAYQFVLDAYANNTNGYAIQPLAVTNPPAYLIFVEEYNSLAYWNSFKDIIFTTTDLPIQTEQLQIGNGSIVPTNTFNLNNGQSNYFPLVTDFEPVLVNAGDARSNIQYYPTGPYRLIDMSGNTALIKLSLQIFWMDRNNNLYPITLSVGASASVKLMFIKKSVVKGEGADFGLEY